MNVNVFSVYILNSGPLRQPGASCVQSRLVGPVFTNKLVYLYAFPLLFFSVFLHYACGLLCLRM